MSDNQDSRKIRAARYRASAATARQSAESSGDTHMREAFLKLAGEWDAMEADVLRPSTGA